MITAHVEQRFEIETDAVTAAHYRAAALLDAGLGLDGQRLPVGEIPDSLPAEVSDARFLDAELVAMYW